MDRPGTSIILDKKYNIANSLCHFGSYGSSFGLYNIFLVTDRSIYCHMSLSAMNYLLYMTSFKRFDSKPVEHKLFAILYFLSKIMEVPGRSIYYRPYTKIVTGCANKDK
jgi:hypothetical protein